MIYVALIFFLVWWVEHVWVDEPPQEDWPRITSLGFHKVRVWSVSWNKVVVGEEKLTVASYKIAHYCRSNSRAIFLLMNVPSYCLEFVIDLCMPQSFWFASREAMLACPCGKCRQNMSSCHATLDQQWHELEYDMFKLSSGWWFGCHQFYFPIYWESHHPNWLSYFSEGLKPPTRSSFQILRTHWAAFDAICA